MHNEDFKIYNLGSSDKIRKYIRENTDVLDGISDDDIKQIETDFYNSIYVLFKNGTLYKDRELIEDDVNRLWMLNGFNLFAIMSNNTIKSITSRNDLHEYIKDEEYKKILTSTLYLVALTKDGKVKCIHGDPTGLGIIPDNFLNVDDVLIKTDLEIPYIKKAGKEMSLFVTDFEED